MAVIRIKRGTGVPGSLALGELAFDTTDKKLFGGDGTSVYWVGGLIETSPADWTSATKLATQSAINTTFMPKGGGTFTGSVNHNTDARFTETGGGTDYVGFQAPSAVTTSIIWKLPGADGGANTFLKTDGAGNLTWATPAGGGSVAGSNTQIQYNSGGAFAASANFTFDGTDVTMAGDLNLNGADLKTTATGTATLFNTNATTLNIGGAATTVSLGASTGTTTVNNNLTVGGNLTVNGTTFTINSTVTTLDDPILTLGGDTAPVADDNKDRGIEYRWHNGSAAKVGFFGYDDSTGYFTFIPDATNTSEVFSGTAGTAQFAGVTGLNNLTGTTANDSGITITATHSDTNAVFSIVGGITGDGQATLTGVTLTIQGDSVNGGKLRLRESGSSPTQYGVLVPTTLSANRTYTLPDADGTVITTGNLTSITTVGTITTGTWSGTQIAANKGGTGQVTYTVGDVLYASGSTALSKLNASSTAGAVLASTGSGAAPEYKTISVTNGSATSGSGTLTLAIQNAAADGSTKGIAAFNSTSFSASSGVIDLATVDGGTF